VLNITNPKSPENLPPASRRNPLISGNKIKPRELLMLKSTALPKGGNPNLTEQDIREVLKYMHEKFTNN
jgi:hypothetical protein